MNMLLKSFVALALLLLMGSFTAFTASCESPLLPETSGKSPAGYDFSAPASKFELPEILLEVSGLTDLDNNTLACVQDEDGIVFVYDLNAGEISRQFKFAGPGDYEGITRVGSSLYVLRSDGKIYEIDDYTSENFTVTAYDTDLPVKESEGLGFDAVNNRLFIAGKTKPKGAEYEGRKVVYGFDLATKTASSTPVLSFSETTIEKAFPTHGIKKSGKKKDKDLSINPSAIAVHPVTDQLYVLSSMDNLLYVFNRTNEVEGIYALNKKQFAQPEGITFLDNGDMFISNEGKKGAPTLLRFNYGDK
ncbi:SdiA-regulated domain-containing protein [Neolewinella antarctica]|uniref:Uncharacterized protein YjiK n=1 Tax=Neolewinella antarctica TaxID=442734 RepID=A0ABX0XCZ3_9BACT|nr:SdiA-regulated domain-containing protein [Neolewinella antarctica]NJC26773.1 uncharacterized protein YjiK [Neolewinella antarctica]